MDPQEILIDHELKGTYDEKPNESDLKIKVYFALKEKDPTRALVDIIKELNLIIHEQPENEPVSKLRNQLKTAENTIVNLEDEVYSLKGEWNQAERKLANLKNKLKLFFELKAKVTFNLRAIDNKKLKNIINSLQEESNYEPKKK